VCHDLRSRETRRLSDIEAGRIGNGYGYGNVYGYERIVLAAMRLIVEAGQRRLRSLVRAVELLRIASPPERFSPPA
jgi:hypothetical protein